MKNFVSLVHAFGLVALLTGGMMPATVLGQSTNAVSVNPASVLNDVSNKPFGINTNTWVDDQANRPAGSRTLPTAFSEMGAKFLRFPGGEKADTYLWSTSPYNAPNPRLARTGPTDYPARNSRIWNLSTDTWANSNYDFDEFMADCRAVGGEPVLVVAFDGMYKPANGGASLTYDQALEMAKAWVHYANVVKGYSVKYWSLGNETWINNSYAGSNPGYTQYGTDVATFAQAMKAIDPTIKIGINGNNASNFNLALARCAAYIDFLDVHTYPCYGFKEYSSYANNNISPLGVVNEAQSAINALPNAADRNRIFIAMTEISALGYTGGNWDNANAVNHGLANFDLLAQLANDSRVKFTQFWNTRWVSNNDNQFHPEDALAKNNDLNASGKALSILFNNVHDKMVGASSTASVRTFASYNSSTRELTVFLLNKSQTPSSTTLTLQDYSPNVAVEKWVYKGTDITDVYPTYTQQASATAANNAVDLTLDPASITVLKFTALVAAQAVNLVANPGFEVDQYGTQHPTSWNTWSPNGNEADYTQANYPHSGNYKGVHWKASPYEVFTYQTITGLANGTYTLKAWATSSGGQTYNWMEASGYGGNKLTRTLPTTNSWQQITIPNIQVTNGKCNVGIYSKAASSSQWCTFDDVEFTQDAPVGAGRSLRTQAVTSVTAPVLRVVPSPTNDQAFLQWTGVQGRNGSISVSNTQGKVIYRQGFTTDSYMLKTAAWPVGLYVVTVQYADVVLKQKLLVIH